MAKKIKWSKIKLKERGWKTARKIASQTKYDMVWKNLETPTTTNKTAN